MPYVPCVPARSTCQRSNVANTCQLVIFTCQHANKSVKCAPIFQTFLLQNAKGNFYTLSLYKKYYIILDIIVIHMFMYHTCKLCYTSFLFFTVAGSRDFEKGCAPFRSPWLADERNFRFQMV